MLLHLVDIAPLDGDADPVHDARAIVKELQRYDEALFDKPRWLVLNKLDLVPEERARRSASRPSSRRTAGRARCSPSPPSTARAAASSTFAIQDWLDAHPAAVHGRGQREARTDDAAPVIVSARARADPPPQDAATHARAGPHQAQVPSAQRDGTPVSSRWFADAKRLVVKVGSSLVTNDGRGLDHAAVAQLGERDRAH